MMYPYAEFLLAFDQKHGALTHRNRPENDRAAIIVETRPLYFLPKVIRNHVHFLGPQWNLYVLAGERSFDYLARSLAGWAIRLAKLPGVYHLPQADYNDLLTNEGFWSGLSERHVLVFQTDTLLTGAPIEPYLAYDYVGAPCVAMDEGYVANGGLSLRRRELMLDCLASVPRLADEAEDVYFTRAVRALRGAMPDFVTATRFAVESVYTGHPVGVHGTDKCFHGTDVAAHIVAQIRY